MPVPRQSSAPIREEEHYAAFLSDLKGWVRQSRLQAALAVNKELLLRYWHVGRAIVERQEKSGWSKKVIARLSRNLQRECPEIQGFSVRNLNYMQAFALAYDDEQFVEQLAAQILWGHHMCLLDQVKASKERVWYIQQTIEHAWSRAELEVQIKNHLYHRQGEPISPFSHPRSAGHPGLTHPLLNDAYHFHSFGFSGPAHALDDP